MPKPLQVDPEFPLRHRMDLPEHERGISREAWESLQRGLADAKAGRVKPLDWSLLAPEDDE